MWTLTQPQTIHNYWPIPMHNYWLHRSKRRITKHINNFRLKKKNETVLILIIENMYQCCIKKSNGKMKIKSDMHYASIYFPIPQTSLMVDRLWPLSLHYTIICVVQWLRNNCLPSVPSPPLRHVLSPRTASGAHQLAVSARRAPPAELCMPPSPRSARGSCPVGLPALQSLLPTFNTKHSETKTFWNII